ncbi:protein LSM12 [Tanacetum coccineum]|uniref:Protein LSM12 n=1 Tax=Tanacetum coccineum TaxID=301880 RepID=A0ABQ4ZQ17_9ASTR
MDKEEEQKTIDTEEYEYGNIVLENEEDDDEYDAMYMELEEEKVDNVVKEDFEQIEELKPLRVSSWTHPKSGKVRHGIEVVTRKDDAQVDFDDYTNLCLATRIKLNPNRETRIPKRTDEPDVCSICYRVWTSHGSLVFLVGMHMECHVLADGLKSLHAGGRPIYATRICNLAADQKSITATTTINHRRHHQVNPKHPTSEILNQKWTMIHSQSKHSSNSTTFNETLECQVITYDRPSNMLVLQEGLKSSSSHSSRRNISLLKANYIKEFTLLGQSDDDPLDLKKCFLDLNSLQSKEEMFSWWWRR